MTRKTRLREMQTELRNMMAWLNEMSQEDLESEDEAAINELYQDMRAIDVKMGRTARTLKV